MLIFEIIDEFLIDCAIKSLSPRTIKSYKNNLYLFFRPMENMELEKVTAANIRSRILEYQERELKATYITHKIIQRKNC